MPARGLSAAHTTDGFARRNTGKRNHHRLRQRDWHRGIHHREGVRPLLHHQDDLRGRRCRDVPQPGNYPEPRRGYHGSLRER